MHLREDLFEGKEKSPTRSGFGKGAVEAGKADERVVVLSADLAESTRADAFQKEFPERFVEVGVAEQNMATVGAGMAAYGKIPFITSYATFSPGRNWEQIRTTIAINNVPVKICGMHAGLLTGPDGATHQALEDIALMRAMPNMIVISPCDAEEGRKATLAAAKNGLPTYLRFARDKTPVMTTPETPFEIGKAQIFWKSKNPKVAVFATGPLVYNALLAARELEGHGIGTAVVNVHTIKPLDKELIVALARETGSVVTVEEHQIMGGLGGAIAELLARECPTPIEFVGIQDKFGQSGEPKELMEHYGLGVSHISAAVSKVLGRK
ncbi:transketolase [Candidatus Kaiserbacteria bacterium RIFCSPHIGHO2_02_FULL_49_16]|uniref:Transketolase n=1 Tax=Candidatus Kaiserbacteria bacterium RIFCSPHIGHO2_02_FULL_49_16 TaxID=1798490 RepID=A0A1F6DCY4_9BACT|nr:MAG: transketolase [Candidatus Kaiserbacteria bacterium RIFCSPHIGHO2_02_FULL_49_16]